MTEDRLIEAQRSILRRIKDYNGYLADTVRTHRLIQPELEKFRNPPLDRSSISSATGRYDDLEIEECPTTMEEILSDIKVACKQFQLELTRDASA